MILCHGSLNISQNFGTNMNIESEILEGGIGIDSSISDSPASSLRRTTSALLTNIRHRYDADDVCIDCGYDEGERYMQPQKNTNPTRMMLRSAERKAYENVIEVNGGDPDYMTCDDISHDYGRADICITCLVDLVRKEIYAKGRQDEAAKREADGPWFRSVVHECCERVQTERAAALRDAVVVANGQRLKFKARDWDDAIDAVIDAIEALGDEQ